MHPPERVGGQRALRVVAFKAALQPDGSKGLAGRGQASGLVRAEVVEQDERQRALPRVGEFEPGGGERHRAANEGRDQVESSLHDSPAARGTCASLAKFTEQVAERQHCRDVLAVADEQVMRAVIEGTARRRIQYPAHALSPLARGRLGGPCAYLPVGQPRHEDDQRGSQDRAQQAQAFRRRGRSCI